MKHLMPQLPFSPEALAPKISAETIEYHYGKHLQTYVDNLNRLVAGTLYEDMSLCELVCKAEGPVFNNAAQAWNHAFYFAALTPHPTNMGPTLAGKITQGFGSIQEFKEQLLQSATALFGSGWTWLVAKADGSLAIVNKSNADNPMRDELKPLLTIDVWEHAYYIDYRNRRADYLKALWELIDWQVVEERLNADECNVYI